MSRRVPPEVLLELRRTETLKRIPAHLHGVITEAAREYDEKIARDRMNPRSGGRPRKRPPTEETIDDDVVESFE